MVQNIYLSLAISRPEVFKNSTRRLKSRFHYRSVAFTIAYMVNKVVHMSLQLVLLIAILKLLSPRRIFKKLTVIIITCIIKFLIGQSPQA